MEECVSNFSFAKDFIRCEIFTCKAFALHLKELGSFF